MGAKSLEQLGKDDLSLNWAQRAASLDPGYAEPWYLMARVYKKLGRDAEAEEARKHFADAKDREPARRR